MKPKHFILLFAVTILFFSSCNKNDLFEQPDVTVNDLEGTFIKDGTSRYIFDFNIDCTVKNNDKRGATVSEIEYTVEIEGVDSETHLYSDSYSESFTLETGGTTSLNLPFTLNLDSETGQKLADAIADGDIKFKVKGDFQITDPVNTLLPLSFKGDVPASIIDDLFEQPTVEVTGCSLKELPGDTTYLDIDLLVTNNDVREAPVKDIDYEVTINGLTAFPEQADINRTLLVNVPLKITLPLRLLTNDAIRLLEKLDTGESLDYTVTGTFHVDEPVLELFDLPIDIQGTANIDVGYDDFYEQPDINVNDIDGTYTVNGISSVTFNLNVNTTVKNLDNRNVLIDEVEYVVFVEGVESATHYYSDTYSNDLAIAGNDSVSLTLPVTLNLGYSEGISLMSKLTDGTASYTIEGTFHAVEVDGAVADFMLPLYDTGTVPVSVISNK